MSIYFYPHSIRDYHLIQDQISLGFVESPTKYTVNTTLVFPGRINSRPSLELHVVSGTTTPVQLLYPLKLNDLGTMKTENAEKVEERQHTEVPSQAHSTHTCNTQAHSTHTCNTQAHSTHTCNTQAHSTYTCNTQAHSTTFYLVSAYRVFRRKNA